MKLDVNNIIDRLRYGLAWFEQREPKYAASGRLSEINAIYSEETEMERVKFLFHLLERIEKLEEHLAE